MKEKRLVINCEQNENWSPKLKIEYTEKCPMTFSFSLKPNHANFVVNIVGSHGTGTFKGNVFEAKYKPGRPAEFLSSSNILFVLEFEQTGFNI